MFGLIVVTCIASTLSDTYGNDFLIIRVCYFDHQDGACDFGMACGSLTVLVAALICGFDFVGSHSAAVQQFRQIVLLVSSGVAVLISIMWLVCFVIL